MGVPRAGRKLFLTPGTGVLTSQLPADLCHRSRGFVARQVLCCGRLSRRGLHLPGEQPPDRAGHSDDKRRPACPQCHGRGHGDLAPSSVPSSPFRPSSRMSDLCSLRSCPGMWRHSRQREPHPVVIRSHRPVVLHRDAALLHHFLPRRYARERRGRHISPPPPPAQSSALFPQQQTDPGQLVTSRPTGAGRDWLFLG